MKCILKNCPAINDRLCKLEKDLTHCIDVSDCLLKQIFEICEENECDCIGECGNYNVATRILGILSVQKESEGE